MKTYCIRCISEAEHVVNWGAGAKIPVCSYHYKKYAREAQDYYNNKRSTRPVYDDLITCYASMEQQAEEL